ncbi:MAG: hypothetical protein M0R47_16965 [Methylobacter sp.]|nr:hypothetical protein [Methylobacter sp.]MCK9622215.1 hypothetical protein [Methylobacter sp.]
METNTGHIITWIIVLALGALLIIGAKNQLQDIAATYRHAMTVNHGLPMP